MKRRSQAGPAPAQDPLERITSRAWKNADALLCYPEDPSAQIPAMLQVRFLEKRLELDLVFKVAGFPVAWTFDVQRAEFDQDPTWVAKSFSSEGSRFFLPMTTGVAAKRMEDSIATSIVKLDVMLVELGLQTEDRHEYFLSKGEDLSGALVLERDANLGAQYPWLATMIDRWPAAMYQPMVMKSGAPMPPDGVSALPTSLEKTVPEDMRYWKMAGEEALKARDALASSGLLSPGTIASVDGSLCRVVQRLELAEIPDLPIVVSDWPLQKISGFLPDGTKLVEVFSAGGESVAKSDQDQVIYVDAGEALDGALDVLASSLSKHDNHYVVTCVDSPAARVSMSKMGRPFRFKAHGDVTIDTVKRVFVTSFGVRADVEWLDKADIQCMACKRAPAAKEVLWAGGRGIANLCEKCTKAWESESEKEKDPSRIAREVVRVRSLKQVLDVPEPPKASDTEEPNKKPGFYSGGTDDKPDLGKAASATDLIEVKVSGTDASQAIKRLLENIEKNGRTGHSFGIKGDDGVTLGGWDGDGGWHIHSVETRSIQKAADFNNPDAGIGPGTPGYLQPAAQDPKKKPLHLKLTKAEKPDEQIVYGIVLEPDVVDAQQDTYSADEVRASAHKYMLDYQHVGLMHKQLIDGKADVIESYISPCAFSMGGQSVKEGTWIMAVKIVDPTLWKSVKDGELTGFSIGGNARRTPEKEATQKAMREENHQGIVVKIDRPKGYVQTGTDPDGAPWSREYKMDYGYIPRTKGGDAEGLDVFLGPNDKAPMSYWAKQMKADGSFDEWKCFLGFDSAQDVHKAYAEHIPERFLAGITPIPVDHMRALLNQEPDGSGLPT